jgi:hypothetical protein
MITMVWTSANNITIYFIFFPVYNSMITESRGVRMLEKMDDEVLVLLTLFTCKVKFEFQEAQFDNS